MKDVILTHGNKAEFYDIGRIQYPTEFFDAIYAEFGISENSIIADIGSGTGKVTKEFLERGNQVYAIEPDSDMRRIADKNLKTYQNYISTNKTAEDTGLPNDSVDYIFCGNSFMWFDHSKVIVEFQRILRPKSKIIISNLGNGNNEFDCEIAEICQKYRNSDLRKIPDTRIPFQEGSYLRKTIDFTVEETYEQFLCGTLSSSYAPGLGDTCFYEYCDAIHKLFNRYSNQEKLSVNMHLSFIVV